MTTTVQAVSRVLANSGVERSRTGHAKITSTRFEGYVVEKDYKKEIIVSYASRTGSLHYGKTTENFMIRKAEAMKTIETFLTSKGYTVTTNDRGDFIVTKAGN